MVDFADDVKACVSVLERGGTILYPTDTVWGIGCDATNEAAVDAVFRIKRRPPDRSLIVLLADARDVLRFVAAPPPDVIAILEAFSIPTTVIFDQALGFADNAVAPDGSIAIRIPQDPFCRALIKRFRKPVISTSANISGTPAPGIFAEISPEILQAVDYVVRWRQDDRSVHPPSRIVRLTDEGDETVVRA